MVREFWTMVGNILNSYFPQFRLGRKEAIFGDIDTKGDSVINTMLILAKKFLWTRKFGSKNLDEIQFIIFMKQELKFLLDKMEYKGEGIRFSTDWAEIIQHFEAT